MTNPIEQYGYKAQTTFWMDFTIADRFGENAVRDTYKRAMRTYERAIRTWKDNHIYLTELAMVLSFARAWEMDGNLQKSLQYVILIVWDILADVFLYSQATQYKSGSDVASSRWNFDCGGRMYSRYFRKVRFLSRPFYK